MRRVGWFLCVMLGLPLLATRVAAAPLERRPYLQSSTPNQITIVWTTAKRSTGSVRYGTNPAALITSVTSPAPATQHEIRLTGLLPKTRYYYEVLSDGASEAVGDDYWFVTPPPVGTKSKLRAWVVGDSGTAGAMQATVRDTMLAHTGPSRPDIFVHLGDMAYVAGTATEFTGHFYAIYQDILRNTVVWPTFGNHEGITSDSASESGPYYDGYVLPSSGQAGGLASGTEAYYAFDHANVHFMVLDSEGSLRDPAGAMLTWASNDLASTQQDWVVAYWHHPPYTKGSHNSDTEAALVDMRENALPILEAGGVDLVLCGHSHIYERSFLLDGAYATPSVAGDGVLDANDGLVLSDGPYAKAPGQPAHDGAVYIVAGHGGAAVSQVDDHPLMYFSEAENGSCILDVQDNRLTVMNLRWDGEVTDRVDIVKGDAIVLGQPNGGERLGKEFSYEVRWATQGDVDNVRLDYSTSNGETWTQIEASVPNTGSYTWTLPVLDTTRALVRVRDADGGPLTDESNGVFTISGHSDIDVISFGDPWRYHDTGQDLGDGWVAVDYDDGAWLSGPAQLGYGDGDEATLLVDADPNYPSAYFRTEFTLTEAPIAAELTTLFDDGAAVWINGTQVWSANVDDTSYAAFASAASEDNRVVTDPIDASALVQGVNVVAVMVKQRNADSSDLSFDMRLTVTVLHDSMPPSDDGDGGSTADDGTGAGAMSDGSAEAQDGVPGTTDAAPADSTAITAGAADGGGSGCACSSTHRRALPAWLLWIPLLVRRRR